VGKGVSVVGKREVRKKKTTYEVQPHKHRHLLQKEGRGQDPISPKRGRRERETVIGAACLKTHRAKVPLKKKKNSN